MTLLHAPPVRHASLPAATVSPPTAAAPHLAPACAPSRAPPALHARLGVGQRDVCLAHLPRRRTAAAAARRAGSVDRVAAGACFARRRRVPYHAAPDVAQVFGHEERARGLVDKHEV
eukprot:50638-Chlamydomonas_euryale.AAC.3